MVVRGELVLTTEDGYSTTNQIVLEPEVLQALIGYVIRKGLIFAPPGSMGNEDNGPSAEDSLEG